MSRVASSGRCNGLRKAAENSHTGACLQLANNIYGDYRYAREVGHVGEADGVAASAGVTEGHDIPLDVMTGLLHWLRKGGHDLVVQLEGCMYCHNEGCEVVGLLKDFKVCPQCKTARYCGDACQKQDWNAGGHKEKCGTFAYYELPSTYDAARLGVEPVTWLVT